MIRSDAAVGHRLLKTLVSWDLVMAVLAAAGTLLLLLATSRPLHSVGTAAAIAIPFGVTIAGINVVSLRWVSDRLKDTYYGQIIRSRDPGEVEVSLPYLILAVVGFSTSALGIAGVALQDVLNRPLTVGFFTLAVFFGVYSILGTLSTTLITLGHQRRFSRLKRTEDDVGRSKRKLNPDANPWER